MIKLLSKNIIYITAILALGGCEYLNTHTPKDFLSSDYKGNEEYFPDVKVANSRLRTPSSIIVCRSHQCAPAKLSMSKEYIYNSLLHLFDNNNYQKALICKADAGSHTCLENYITLPVTVGITPTNAYIDYVKITDVIIGKKADKINLILNYNLTYGGQTPDCTPARSILFAKNINHVLLEDSGYSCKMTTIGQTTVKTIFAIDYIDLDYGFIGGYYSIGFSGPAYGGSNGYMLLRLPKNAYPLAPELQAPKVNKKQKNATPAQKAYRKSILDTGNSSTRSAVKENENGVKIFPLGKGAAAPNPNAETASATQQTTPQAAE